LIISGSSDVECTVIQYYNTDSAVKHFLIPAFRAGARGSGEAPTPIKSKDPAGVSPCAGRSADRLALCGRDVTFQSKRLEVRIGGAPRTLIHNSVLNENIMRSESMMYEGAD